MDNTNLTTDQTIAPANLFLHTLFESCQVLINGTPINSNSNYYPYSSYIQTLLSTGQEVKTTSLTNELFFKDKTPDTFISANSRFTSRLAIASQSRSFELLGRPCISIFQQNKFLPPNVDLNIIFRRSSPQFCLTGTAFEFKVIIEQAVFYLKKHQIHPSVLSIHQTAFLKGRKAHYPIRHTEVKTFSIANGSLQYTSQSI